MKNLTAVDLFTGAGGMSEGFKSQGFATLYANEFNKDALKTFQRNNPSCRMASPDDIRGVDPTDVRKELSLAKGSLDVLLGGPPCQGFSTYGKRDPSDLRSQLYIDFFRFIAEFRPKTFVMENVVGMLSMAKGKLVEDILERASALGYSCNRMILDSVHYGVPQRRKRVFIVGSLASLVQEPEASYIEGPEISRSSQSQLTLFAECDEQPKNPALTIRDAISDLSTSTLKPRETHESLDYTSPPLTNYQCFMRRESSTLENHSSKQMMGIRRVRLALMNPGEYGLNVISRLKNGGVPDELIDQLFSGSGLRELSQCRPEDQEKELRLRDLLKSGGSYDDIAELLDFKGFANKYRRLKWDEPSHTLVAHMARDCSDFIHPDLDRFISVREAARLQSFPDHYYFEGSQFAQFKQIGNAVPPLLASAIAGTIKSHLNSGGSKNRQKRLALSQA